MKDKKRKYQVGDIVSLKGQKEDFEIREWFYECSYHVEDGLYERSSYTLKGVRTGKFYDLIDEDDEDLSLVKSIEPKLLKVDEDEEVLEEVFTLEMYNKPLTKEEVDFLLDKYNDYMNVHLLVTHLGVDENEYKDMADQILKYLAKQ